MRQYSNKIALFFALAAAALYAINVPVSKMLLSQVPPTIMASFLYLGAGIGVGLMYLFNRKREQASKLSKADLPYTIAMIVLDIAAPIFLMIGISLGSSSNASLLGNFEIVATSIIALVAFKEAISLRLWIAILLITISSMILSFEGSDSLRLSIGSLFVLLATLCWGIENNCTRKISSKSTYEIVILKGLFSGGGSLMIALYLNETFPSAVILAIVLMLGFVAYGLSIFLYVRAQSVIGAAKTSAYYAVTPFIGALLSFIILKEQFTGNFVLALVIMIAGTILVVIETLGKEH